MIQLTPQRRLILGDLPKHLRDFTRREWSSVFIWAGLGAMAAGLARLSVWDPSFQAFLRSKYAPVGLLDDARLYVPYMLTIAIAFLLAITFHILAFTRRGLRSWWAGVTSGLALLPFTSTFVLLSVSDRRTHVARRHAEFQSSSGTMGGVRD